MGFLGKFFGINNNLTLGNIRENIKIGQHFYLMTYGDYYAEFLVGIENKDKIIAELFVFRAWTTQFGFRLFSSHPEISEEIIGDVFNQGKLGRGMLNQLEHVDIETETKMPYVELVDSRWQAYDKVFIANKSSDTPVPTSQICAKLTDYCDMTDPIKIMWICTDFAKHLENIKQEAILTGLLK